MAGGQICREAHGLRLCGDTATAVYRIVSGVHAQPSRRWTEDGSPSVLPANHVRPHNAKGEAAVAGVKDVDVSHVSTWASETVWLLVHWIGNMVRGVR